jgi:superfamily II DNA or RNA helicase
MCEWPENISVFIQRRGRLVRDGSDGECHLVASLDNFIFLFARSALRQHNAPDDTTTPATALNNSNSIFSPQTRQCELSDLDRLTNSKMKKVAFAKMKNLLDMGRLYASAY